MFCEGFSTLFSFLLCFSNLRKVLSGSCPKCENSAPRSKEGAHPGQGYRFFPRYPHKDVFVVQTQAEEIKVFVPVIFGIHCEDASNRAKKPLPESK